MEERNWAGNYAYGAHTLHRPSTLEEAQEIIAGAERIRVLGSRHCFNEIADSAELVSLDGLPTDVVVDHDAGTVTLNGAMRYGELAEVLRAEGVALANLASLPHISVAGAVATGTHGSGDLNGNLATSVSALELITSSGELLTVERGDEDFQGMVVNLGALGAVSRITLEVEPAYEIRQRVFEGLEWQNLYDNYEEITSAGYSVSVFTRWGAATDQVWIKSRVTDAPEEVRDDLFGATPSTVDRHPILGLDPVHCSPQLGDAGLWSDRLPHFRMGFTPSSGQELQSEYLMPRDHAVAAIEAVRALADVVAPVLLVSELRTVAADELWMSPQYGQDTVGVHFTLDADPEGVGRALEEVEAALMPLRGRPHWGKLFLAEAAAVAPLYPRLEDFAALRARLDPRGVFRNAWLERRVLGAR